MQEPLVVLRSVSKSFGPRRVLDSFSLDIAAGDIHVLLGHNGSGKSTLIKIVSGYHAPDPGAEIHVAGRPLVFGAPDDAYRAGCRFVHQNLGLVSTCSVMDNLLLTSGFPTRLGTISRRAAVRRVRAAFDRIGVDVALDELVGKLTPARRTAVAIARALLEDPAHPARLLVMDEPTATMPGPEVDHLMEIVRGAAREDIAVLYVTHHLDEALDLGDWLTVLRDGAVVDTFARGDVDRAQLTESLVGAELVAVASATSAERAGSVGRGPATLRVDDLRSPALSGISFEVRPGEILGIAGLVGSGRESVLPSVFGALDRDHGTVEVAGTIVPPRRPDRSIAAGVAYMPSDRDALGGIMTLSAAHNVTLPSLRPLWVRGMLRARLERKITAELFRRFQVHPAEAVEAPLQSFSGGNQQKILIGKWLRQKPIVFLIDEPTQGVDVGAQAELHRQLIAAAEQGAALVVSSSDSDELALLCSRVLIVRDGVVAHELVS